MVLLQVGENFYGNFSDSVRDRLLNLSIDKQRIFFKEYERRSKNTGKLLLLAIFFPITLFLLGKKWLGIVFLLTLGGMGIWWLIEIFLIPQRVKEFNEKVALKIIEDIDRNSVKPNKR